MFEKILIVEDFDTVHKSLSTFLKTIGKPKVDIAPYCDEAYLKCKRAALDQDPYDLLICDLSFKADHRNEKITSGEELSILLNKELPDLKIIIHSIEDHPSRIRKLKPFINGYVCKGRKGMEYLKIAIDEVSKGNFYLSPDLETALSQSNIKELTEYETQLLRCLAEGYTMDEICAEFMQKGLSPGSKSAIEKRLKELKDEFGAKNNTQLIGIVLSLQLI